MGVIKKAIKPMFKRSKWNIVRGDTVKILAGKDKGQVGTITKVIRDVRIPRVIVEGLNLVRSWCATHARERERDLLQVPQIFVGTLQPL